MRSTDGIHWAEPVAVRPTLRANNARYVCHVHLVTLEVLPAPLFRLWSVADTLSRKVTLGDSLPYNIRFQRGIAVKMWTSQADSNQSSLLDPLSNMTLT